MRLLVLVLCIMCMSGSGEKNVPSQGSGSVLEARSSIENFTSWPFSRRDSGSAFMSQYCRAEVFEGFVLVKATGSAGLAGLGDCLC